MKIYLLLILSVMSLFAYSSALPSVCDLNPFPFRAAHYNIKHLYYTFNRTRCESYISFYRYPNLNQFASEADCKRICQIPYEKEMKERAG